MNHKKLKRKKQMRILGLDIGTVRIGVALSDEMGWTAQPLEVIRHTSDENDIEEIRKIVEEYGVDSIVVGLPMNMDGSIGPMAEKIRKINEKLEQNFDIPIIEWDERLSSVAVERVLLEGDVRRDKRKLVVDKMAASYILQGYLDSK